MHDCGIIRLVMWMGIEIWYVKVWNFIIPYQSWYHKMLCFPCSTFPMLEIYSPLISTLTPNAPCVCTLGRNGRLFALFFSEKNGWKFSCLYIPLPPVWYWGQRCRIDSEIMSRDHHGSASVHILITAHSIHKCAEWAALMYCTAKSSLQAGMFTILKYFKLYLRDI